MHGVIKLSRIPYGFFENEMMQYFSQFGRVQKLKLFRSKKTGNSKGFAFIQFEHESVAKIAAETMNNYLMFDKLMKCVFIPDEEVLPSMFKRWHQKMIPKLAASLHKKKANSIKDEFHEMRSRGRLYTKLIKRNEECQRLGVNYQFQIPTDPNGKPSSRRVPRKKELKDEENEKSKIATKLDDSLESSSYSLIVDSSDDEIELKTPPNTIKKRKSSRTESNYTTADNNNDDDISIIKDEPTSSGDEESSRPAKKKKSRNSAVFIEIPKLKPRTTPLGSKKTKKAIKKSKSTADGKPRKFRYFNQ